MQEHGARVLDEKRELDLKLVKLMQFITLSPVFAGLYEVQQELLRNQRDHMIRYSDVLADRIGWFCGAGVDRGRG